MNDLKEKLDAKQDLEQTHSNELIESKTQDKTETKELEEDVIHSRPDYESEILELVRNVNSPKLLRENLDEYHAYDISEAFNSMTSFEREKLYKMLDTEQLAEIIEYMDDQDQARFLSEMNIRKVIAIFNEMETDKAADLLKGFDKERSEIIRSEIGRAHV